MNKWIVRQCFRYVSKGKRLLKNQQLIEELEKSLDDKVEKEKLVEGFLGYVICSTQVISSIPLWNVHCSSAANINSHNSYLCRKQWCYHPMLHLLSGWILASGSLSKFIPTICPSKELHRLNTSSSRRHYMTRTGVYSSPISYQEPLHWSQIYWCQLKLYVFLSEFSGQRMTTHWKSILVLLTSQRRIWHCHHPLETGSSLSPNLCLQS